MPAPRENPESDREECTLTDRLSGAKSLPASGAAFQEDEASGANTLYGVICKTESDAGAFCIRGGWVDLVPVRSPQKL